MHHKLLVTTRKRRRPSSPLPGHRRPVRARVRPRRSGASRRPLRLFQRRRPLFGRPYERFAPLPRRPDLPLGRDEDAVLLTDELYDRFLAPYERLARMPTGVHRSRARAALAPVHQPKVARAGRLPLLKWRTGALGSSPGRLSCVCSAVVGPARARLLLFSNGRRARAGDAMLVGQGAVGNGALRAGQARRTLLVPVLHDRGTTLFGDGVRNK